MRIWHFWWQSLVLSSQQNPPRFVEAVMLLLAIVLLVFLLLVWRSPAQWPYLVLSLSYGIGASVSILVRETRSQRRIWTPTIASMLLSLLILLLGLVMVVRDVLIFQ